MKAIKALVFVGLLASLIVMGFSLYEENFTRVGVAMLIIYFVLLPLNAASDGGISGLPRRFAVLMLRTVIFSGAVGAALIAPGAVVLALKLVWVTMSRPVFNALYLVLAVAFLYLVFRLDLLLSRKLWQDRPTWRRLL